MSKKNGKSNVSKQGIVRELSYNFKDDEPVTVRVQPKPAKVTKPVVVAKEETKGFAKLAGLKAPEPANETVSAIALALEETPEYAIWQQAVDAQADADRNYAEAKKILGNERLDELEARIASLQARMSQFKSNTKNAVMNSAGITGDRAKFLEKFGAFITKKVEETIKSDPAYVSMAEELRTAVANAERVMELRQADEAKEKEAQSLLDSIQFSL